MATRAVSRGRRIRQGGSMKTRQVWRVVFNPPGLKFDGKMVLSIATREKAPDGEYRDRPYEIWLDDHGLHLRHTETGEHTGCPYSAAKVEQLWFDFIDLRQVKDTLRKMKAAQPVGEGAQVSEKSQEKEEEK